MSRTTMPKVIYSDTLETFDEGPCCMDRLVNVLSPRHVFG
jgi:hypothetical protein